MATPVVPPTTPTNTAPITPGATPRIYSPLSTFPIKDQQPTGSPLNPLHWGAWFSYQKSKLNLPNPGKFERLHSEAKDTFVTNYLFDGAQANIVKELSGNFHVQHQFSLGSQVMPPMYNFMSGYMTERTMAQGTMDNDTNLNAVVRHAWSARTATKVVAQITHMPGQSMLQIDQDYTGSDFSCNIKAMNPNPLEFTGLYMANYLQSITPNLALGTEVVLQRPTPDMEETAMSLVGKYTGSDFVATAQFQGLGAIQASYYQRINEKVEFGAEMNIMVQNGRREAVATVGGKFDFRQATFRGQIDTTGRVSAVLEEKMAPGFSFLISGDLDHMKGQSKFGVGIMLSA
ncbi:eukaryotic porin-domain-containing protein [Halteromyces radiatus]|uniref:eukaryotic porin-domain-containing protein n=1 Tax=Halteromyces radiatus TaxID=101107 RepID=UPI0022201B69|nr:eukaryotic porin-domain-containing protein [Halteromyces radiatus]KAI8082714.1 eukaryotic porin-domain-containing protein [Halteromyces radiatus]